MIKLFESYTELAEIKNQIFQRAVESGNLDSIDFFLKKGYNINGEDVLTTALQQNMETLRFLLEKGLDVEGEFSPYDERYIKDLDVQKVLIDFGHDFLIYDKVGFNRGLLNDPKYADKVKEVEDMEKYNM